MSLIHTCELNGVNPFDYLTELLRRPAEVAVHPAEWMPWNYRPDAAAVAAEEIRCNFRSPQQYLALAAFCAGDSPFRRARFDPMNAVGGTIHV